MSRSTCILLLTIVVVAVSTAATPPADAITSNNSENGTADTPPGDVTTRNNSENGTADTPPGHYTTSNDSENGTADGDLWTFLQTFLTKEICIAFAVGVVFATIIYGVCLCIFRSSPSEEHRKPRDQDDNSATALVTLMSVDQQNGMRGGTDEEQVSLQPIQSGSDGGVGVEGGEQAAGAVPGAGEGVAKDVDYATIDLNILKKREEEKEGQVTTQTDYAEIKRDKKHGNGHGEDGGGPAAEEGEAGVEMEGLGNEYPGAEQDEVSPYSEIKEVLMEV
ncbi:hypothetical protein AGOR_G00119500 [Albula goreensis]|uniref:Uncharacterized protein n=1 Tax=Albula goreensis TaxID=1534307 RepID=A0A8T3DET9_9TELE|nr:hypothetical protein AGOR_G00119500 [Albula goreensis]